MKEKDLTAVEWYNQQIVERQNGNGDSRSFDEIFEQAKEIEKEQIGYSEEDVRLAYFQGEKDSYVKGGQTKEMEDEFIKSLKQTKQQEQ
jgi:hypothetical protein